MPQYKLMLIVLGLIFTNVVTSQPLEANKIFSSAEYGLVRLSPTGEFYSSYYRGKKEQYIDLMELSSNKRVASIAIGNDTRLNDYQWLNQHQLYLNVEHENRNITLLGDLENRNIRLTAIKTEGYLVSILPEQPNKIMFAKLRRSRRGTRYYDLYIIDIESLKKGEFDDAREIAHNSNNVSHYVFDDRFKRIITSQYNEEEETITVKYMSIQGGRWRKILTLKDTDYSFKALDFINQNTLAVLTNENSDKMVLREFNIEKQSLGKVIYQHPKYDLTSAGFINNGELNYVTYNQHGLRKVRYFDKGKKRFIRRLSKTFVNQDAYIISKNEDNNLFLLYVNGSNEPGEYLVYDSKKDIINRLLVSYPKLAEQQFYPSEQLTVIMEDGTEIEAFLTMPIEINHETLLVMPHGGPIDVQESDRFNKEVQYYASRGFSVLRVNFRGSAGFGKDFIQQGVGEFGQLIEQDITAVVNQVKKEYNFKFMCSMGASYGGYSASMLAIQHPKQYDCVIAAFGIYDLPLLFNTSNYRSGEEYSKSVGQSVGKYDEKMVDISPVYLYEKLKAPILLIAGRDDDTADFEHTNRFHYLLKRNNHPVESMFYKNTGHGHSQWSGDRHEAAVTSDFLMRTLKLPLPKPDKLDKNGKRAIADDFAHIADKYTFNDQIENDKDKAFTYYKKAAEYDHPRANFNIGSLYHIGKDIELNIELAIEYYQKSADLEYPKAHARLGRMYMEGDYVEQNWEKAQAYLTKAQELDDTPFNNIRLARFYCIAPNKLKNIPRCLELMDLKQYEKHSKSRLKLAKEQIRETLSWVMSDAKLTKSEHKKIKQFAIDVFELTHTDVTLEDKRAGAFKYVENRIFGRKGKYKITNDGNEIQSVDDENARFGAIFEVDIPGLNSSRDKVALVARWIKTTLDGRVEYLQNILLFGPPKGEWKMLRSLKEIEEPAHWKLEMYDLNQKLIYLREFNLTPLLKEKSKKPGINK